MSQERAGVSSYQKAVQSLGLGEAPGLTSPGLCAVSLLKPGIGDPAAGQFHLRWEPASWFVDGGFSLGLHTADTHTHTHIHVMKPWILLDQGPPSYDSFDVDWLLKSLSPNIATWGLELQQVNLGHNLVNSSLGPQMSWWLWDCWGQALLAAQSDWEDYMRTKHENVPGALTPGQPPSPKGSTHDWGWCRGQCQGARGSHWPGMRSPTSHEALVLVLSFFCQIGI